MASSDALPPPSILGLIVWTACSAAYLGLARVSDHFEFDGDRPPLTQVSLVLHAIVIGAAMAGVVLIANARFRFPNVPLMAPGHWLLLAVAIFGMWSMMPSPPNEASLTLTLGFILQAAVYALAGIKTEFTGWRIWFSVKAVIGFAVCVLAGRTIYAGDANSSLVMVFGFLLIWGQLGVAIWAVLQPFIDFLHGRRFDWLHWAGVAVFLAYGAVILIGLALAI